MPSPDNKTGDGNKRVALGSYLVVLEINGYPPAPDREDCENLNLAVAAGLLSRQEITAALRKLLHAPSPSA